MNKKTKFKIGDRCKCLHPYAYRGEEPFTIVGICDILSTEVYPKIRLSYVVRYDDGVSDEIPVENDGGYEMVKIE